MPDPTDHPAVNSRSLWQRPRTTDGRKCTADNIVLWSLAINTPVDRGRDLVTVTTGNTTTAAEAHHIRTHGKVSKYVSKT